MDGISVRFYITTRRQSDYVTCCLSTVAPKGEVTPPAEYLFYRLPGGLGNSVLEQLLYDLAECERAYKQQQSPEPLF